MRQIPELLAPVGGEEQLRAAVENGADAVYMGGRMFNARVNAGSFGGDALKESVRYAHSKGVKVYITLNTLVKDEELEEAIAVARECYLAGVDALIVQDFGLGRELRRRLPQMELHLSTQGTVYDLAGVQQAVDMGFERVVLARETPFAQIRDIASKTDVPLEVFVHGALCMCYSGQCQMSRFQGGRSGNRGGCAQPCRLPYEILRTGESASGKIPWENANVLGTSAYRLSPRDMCTVDHLGQLAEAGVASLKIEGRMKSPEYVAVVVSIYRKYLDLYAQYGEYQVSRADREALLQIFNRGSFTDGYLWENPRKNVLSGLIPKHQGVELGKIVKVRTVGEGKAIRQLLTVKLSRDLNLGDGVEVHGLSHDGQVNLSGNIVTYIGAAAEDRQRGGKNGRSVQRDGREAKGGKSWREARRGQVVEIGDIPGQIHPGEMIYKISDKLQMDEARKTFEITSGQAKKESRKLPVNMILTVMEGQPVKLKAVLAEEAAELFVVAVSDQIPEQAMNRALDEEGARRQLEKTGDTMFVLNDLKLITGGGLMVRASALNQLRRDALEQLTQLWELGEARVLGADGDAAEKTPGGEGQNGMEAVATGAKRAVGGLRSLYMFRADEEILALAQNANYDRFYFSYQAFLDEGLRSQLKALAASGKQVIAYLPPITQGREHELIETGRDQIVEAIRGVANCGMDAAAVSGEARSAVSGLAVSNLGQIRLFGGCGLELYGDYGLNLYNSADFAWAKEQGLTGAVVCHEAFDNGFGKGLSAEELAGFGGPARELPQTGGLEGEVVIGGRIPLMISAHCPIGDATGCQGPVNGAGACDGGNYALRDRKRRSYPVLTEKLDCRSIIFSEEFAPSKEAAEEAKRCGYNTRVYGIDKNIF